MKGRTRDGGTSQSTGPDGESRSVCLKVVHGVEVAVFNKQQRGGKVDDESEQPEE